MTLDDGSATFTGTIVSADTLSGAFDWMGQTGTFDIVRSDLSFGLLELSGLVNLSTDRALGFEGEDEIWYRLDFQMRAGTLEGGFAFENHTGLAPGIYSVISREGPDPGPTDIDC